MNLEEYFNFLQKNLLGAETFFFKLSLSLLILFIFWILKKVILKIIWKKIDNVQIRYRIQKTITYLSFFFAIIIIGRVWFEVFQSLATLLGLLSAGIAIALKDLILNFAGWIYILLKKPFELGDRIQIGNYAGDVIDIRIFKFTIMEIGNWVKADQSTGRIIHLPNEYIFNQSLASYSKGFYYIWDEIPVLVTFESNWKKARYLFRKILDNFFQNIHLEAEKRVKEASKKFLIYYSKLTPIVYLSVEDNGILLTMRYLCEPKKRRNNRELIWENILEIIEQNPDIQLAYQTIRYYQSDSSLPAMTDQAAKITPDDHDQPTDHNRDKI